MLTMGQMSVGTMKGVVCSEGPTENQHLAPPAQQTVSNSQVNVVEHSEAKKPDTFLISLIFQN